MPQPAPRARLFPSQGRQLVTARTPTGDTSIARLVDSRISATLGAGIEVLENCVIEWTVTYDEVLYGFEGRFAVESGGETLEVGPGDIVWLPAGTSLRYVATERAAYFYALYPVDWARRQGIEEP